TRQKSTAASKSDVRSNTSRKSSGSRSGGQRRRSEVPSKPPVFLRGVDRKQASEWFDPDIADENDDGLKIWLDKEVLAKPELRGATFATVSVVRPATIYPSLDPQEVQQQKERENEAAGKLSKKVVAKIYPWFDGPGVGNAALSSLVCTALEAEDIVGSIIRVEAAPNQLPRSSVKGLKIYPFIQDPSKKQAKEVSLKLGGNEDSA
ncbi:Peroxisome biosynthesis protein pex1, partial [Ascosphaera atra]